MEILRPIADEEQGTRGWRLKLNGKLVKRVRSLRLESRFGTLQYGMTSRLYDTWAYEEVNRGSAGSVIVPYVVVSNHLYIGLVCQERHAMGGKVWGIPRGYKEKGETFLETACREAGEELGFNLAERFIELSGSPVNPHGGFFVTLDENDGIRFFSLEIKANEVIEETTEYGRVFRLHKRTQEVTSKVGEQIFDAKFFPWEEALQLKDMFTIAGIGRLLPAVMKIRQID